MPGRWRTTTEPPKRMRLPAGRCCELGGGVDAGPAKGLAGVGHRMGPGGEGGGAVVGDRLFEGAHLSQGRRSAVGLVPIQGTGRRDEGGQLATGLRGARVAFPTWTVRRARPAWASCSSSRPWSAQRAASSATLENGRRARSAADRLSRRLVEALDVAQAQAHGAGLLPRLVGGVLPGAAPLRALHTDGAEAHPVALAVLDQGSGVVEAHRPGVQDGDEEGRRMVDFEVAAGVGDESEAGGVRFRETVEGEGGDRLDDLVLGRTDDAAHLHSLPQPSLDRPPSARRSA